MRRYKLHLEDRGQDFTWFLIEGDMIIDAGPFQAWLWAGKRLTAKRFAAGDALTFAAPLVEGASQTLNYRVTKVERVEWEEPSYAKKLALRDAAETGGLEPAARGAARHPTSRQKVYARNTITSLVVDRFLKRETVAGQSVWCCTQAGHDLLPWGWRAQSPKLAGEARS